MKAVLFALLLVLPLGVSAAEVRLGATLAEVNATLGSPRGQVRLGDRQLRYYDRGEIELQAGTVSRVALLSPDEYAALETKRAANAARVREEQEIRRAQVKAEGERLMARKLADSSFQSAPLAYQVAFWEDFSRRYPDVPSAEQLIHARLLYATQLEAIRAKAEQAERLAELEARVRAAEASRWGNHGFFPGYASSSRWYYAPVNWRDNRADRHDQGDRTRWSHPTDDRACDGRRREQGTPVSYPLASLATLNVIPRGIHGLSDSPRLPACTDNGVKNTRYRFTDRY